MKQDGVLHSKGCFMILLCEDDPSIRKICYEQLVESIMNVHISQASSVTEALQLLKQHTKFDLVISDYRLPDGNGMDVYKVLNTISEKIPFILHTSNSKNSFMNYIEKKNFYYVSKDIHLPKSLLSQIKVIIES